jgi:hypothetical protein
MHECFLNQYEFLLISVFLRRRGSSWRSIGRTRKNCLVGLVALPIINSQILFNFFTEIVKAMKQVVEKWDMKQQSFNMVPKQDVELTYPHKCAEELGRLHKVASTVPGSLNEVLSASQVAYEDLATLEREHSSKVEIKI